MGNTKLNDKDKTIIRDTKKILKEDLQHTAPKIWGKIREDAEIQYKTRHMSSKEQGVSFENVFHQTLEQQVNSMVRNDYIFIKSIIGDDLLCYKSDEIICFLKQYFLARESDSLNVLYKFTTNPQKDFLKSTNPKIKSGNISYYYKEYMCLLFRLSRESEAQNMCQRVNNKIKAQEKVFHEYNTNTNDSNIDLKVARHYWDNWKGAMLSLSENINTFLSKEDSSFLEIPTLFEIAEYNVSKIVGDFFSTYDYLIKRAFTSFEKHKVIVLEKYSLHHNTLPYNLTIDYYFHIICKSLREEKSTLSKILQFLYDEIIGDVYPSFDSRYDISLVSESESDYSVLKKFFCENNSMPINDFIYKFRMSESIYEWFKTYHFVDFQFSRLKIMKSIFMECFLYNSLPDVPNIKDYGIVRFTNYIRKGNFQNKYITSAELFYLNKIIRGLLRNGNNMDKYMRWNRFMCSYYQWEENLLSPQYMHGDYIRLWGEAFCNLFQDIYVDIS